MSEVAHLLRRRTKSVANAVNARTNRLEFSDGSSIATIKLGRARLIPRTALEQFLRERGLTLDTPQIAAGPQTPAADAPADAMPPSKPRGRPRKAAGFNRPGGL
ncbi:MAG: DNA-binding protein [Thiomonas sp.]|nr:DNA-binding protein [Thiomonas sp.]